MGSVNQIKKHYDAISTIIMNMYFEELNALEEDIFHDYYVYHKGLVLDKIGFMMNTSSTIVPKSEHQSIEDFDYTSNNPNIGITKVVNHEDDDSELEETELQLKAKVEEKIQLQQILEDIKDLDEDLEKSREEVNYPIALMHDDENMEEQKLKEPKVAESSKEHVCSICFKSFPSFEELKLHEVIRHDVTTNANVNAYKDSEKEKDAKWQEQTGVKCNLCDATFSSDDELNLHEVGRHMTDIGEYRCPECSVKEVIKNVVIQHFYIVHKKKPMYKCNDCHEIHGNTKSLKAHMKTDHGIVLENKTCPLCRDIIKTRGYTVEVHCLDKHSGIDFKCIVCDKKYKNDTSLRAHIARFHRNESKSPEECPYCGKVLCPERMANHIEIHEAGDEPKLQCPFDGCSKKCFTQMDLNAHIDTLHKLRKCDQCDFQSTSKTSWRTHRKSHKSFEERPFKCERCGQRFFENMKLRKHINQVHSDVRNFKCTTCGKAFKEAMKLKIHEKIHKGEYEAFCPECGKGFIQRLNIIQHIKKHHPGSEHLLTNFRVGWNNGPRNRIM